jgi:hypothetical protein
MNVTEERKIKIWQDIIKNIKEELDRFDDEKTIEEFMAEAGIDGKTYARSFLNRLVKEGKMTKRLVPSKLGGRLALYRPKE